MNNLLNMLVKAGYEVSSIGSDVLPCTLRLGNEPIGFLLEDLSIKLLPEQEKEHARITSVINFAAENRDTEQIGEEVKLSQYKDIVFTTAFNYSNCKPLYNVYRQDKDKNLTLLNSSEDKTAAARDFASRSGLVDGNIPTPERETDRIGKFMKFVKDKGYSFRENREDANRAYDILDKYGHVVGFIGKDNKVTITTDNKRINHTLRDAYIDSNSDRNMLPNFFEKLKEHLKEIGLALKVIFSPKGKHYAINNELQQEIASVSEKQHTVTYTDAATKEQKEQIDALVEDLQRESNEKEAPATEKEHTEKETTNYVKTEPQKPKITVSEVRNVAEAVLSDSEVAAAFFQTVLSNPDFVSRLSGKMSDMQHSEKYMKDIPLSVTNEHSPEKQNTGNIKQEFNRYYGLLQTTSGFNPEKYNDILSEMKERFGTADPKKFNAMLENGKAIGTGTLKDRLNASQHMADMKNAMNRPENTHEKERA